MLQASAESASPWAWNEMGLHSIRKEQVDHDHDASAVEIKLPIAVDLFPRQRTWCAAETPGSSCPWCVIQQTVV